jgi:diguanylate cyclase (GGDEF)-like protein
MPRKGGPKVKIKQVEPTFYHILRKSAILLMLKGAVLFLVLFVTGLEWMQQSSLKIYLTILFVFLLSFFTMFLVIRQAIKQSNSQLLVDKEKLALTNEFRQALAILPALMYRLKRDENGEIIIIYQEGKRAEELNFTTEKVKGKLLKEILQKEIFEMVVLPIERALSGNIVEFQVRTETHVFEHTVTPVFDQVTKEVVEVSGYGIDITAKELAKKKMKDLTEFDQLTGLFNRKKYSHLVERFIQEDVYKQITILLIDLDDFKHTNDTLGHTVGDQLLITVSNRLKDLFLPDHYLFRLGGDEFVVLFTTPISREDINKIGEKINLSMKKAICVVEHQLYTSASIGVALYPEHATDAKSLLKQADLAMYRAKNEGKNNLFIYSKDMMHKTIERIEMQKSLRVAIEKEEFTLYYQPQIDVLTNKMVGVEALLRWFHPKKGFISPADFIPIAEETGMMIQEIGEWVFRAACEQFSRWRDNGFEMPISVNLSAKQFKQANLVGMMELIIEETMMDPSRLTIEITESTSMEDVQFTINLLHDLQRKGIEISIDDFGTGYSSLSYLQKLPVNCLKIDQSFIQGIETSPSGIALVKTVIDLAQNLNFSVVAEGVETKEQKDILVKLGCHQIQGFIYSRPVSADEIIALASKPIHI